MSSAMATPTRMRTTTSPAATLYWRVSGVALAATAVLGILLNAVGQADVLGAGFLAFDWTHNIVHVLLAVVALGIGFSTVEASLSKNLAKVVGIVYLGLGVVGFLPGIVDALDSMLGLHLELGENLVHLVIGAWGVYAGFTTE